MLWAGVKERPPRACSRPGATRGSEVVAERHVEGYALSGALQPQGAALAEERSRRVRDISQCRVKSTVHCRVSPSRRGAGRERREQTATDRHLISARDRLDPAAPWEPRLCAVTSQNSRRRRHTSTSGWSTGPGHCTPLPATLRTRRQRTYGQHGYRLKVSEGTQLICTVQYSCRIAK